ncbi:hypothetical protein GN958_ATG12664 [Phytophthora infestans]|uniref:Uncharacterized protein n=1 Tax=Phytophthora infestans TaxID=4787 RepID=A0A8S9UCC3_PHYIN|nr:hypothetical protein GN958_ATG13663 [Phytophthora infestans]KAF4138147.1 hypothetical protein GN958_ATG12664 [Phytophthora infestans]
MEENDREALLFDRSTQTATRSCCHSPFVCSWACACVSRYPLFYKAFFQKIIFPAAIAKNQKERVMRVEITDDNGAYPYLLYLQSVKEEEFHERKAQQRSLVDLPPS